MNCSANSTRCRSDLRKVVSEPPSRIGANNGLSHSGNKQLRTWLSDFVAFQNPTPGGIHEITHSVVCCCDARLVEQFGRCSTRHGGAACAFFRNSRTLCQRRRTRSSTSSGGNAGG